MKIIDPSATLMEHNIPPYRFIEKVGRICYKSEDKMTEGSAEKMVLNLINSKHLAMLEHEHIYIKMSERFMTQFLADMECYNERLTFFNITNDSYKDIHILSGSFRSFYELFEKGYVSYHLNHLREYLCNNYPLVFGNSTFNYKSHCNLFDCMEISRLTLVGDYSIVPEVLSKHLIHTFKFVCDRGVSHEFVRHRVASFAQESTRYCNYSLGKFNNEITVIEPCFWEKDTEQYQLWFKTNKYIEEMYLQLIHSGATPQEARTVLPNSLKTELIITATEEEWQHIVDLRFVGTTGSPHPQIRQVMSLALEPLINQTHGRVNIVDKNAR